MAAYRGSRDRYRSHSHSPGDRYSKQIASTRRRRIYSQENSLYSHSSYESESSQPRQNHIRSPCLQRSNQRASRHIRNPTKGYIQTRKPRSRSHSRFRHRDTKNAQRRRLVHHTFRRSTSSSQHSKDCSHQEDTTMVILKNLPIDVTEDIIETSVRSAAISLCFSPPNFVRCVMLNDQVVALVDFPSTDSATDFIKTCSNSLRINDRKVRLSKVILPPGVMSDIAISDATFDWQPLIANCMDSMGQVNHKSASSTLDSKSRIPLPSPSIPSVSSNPLRNRIDQLESNIESGLIYSDDLNFQYDLHSESLSLANTAQTVNKTSHQKVVPANNKESTRFHDAHSIEKLNWNERSSVDISRLAVDQSDSLEIPINKLLADPATSKATAIASILASAQLAAAATKQVVKSKSIPQGSPNTLSIDEEVSKSINVTASSEGAPTVQQLFACGDDDILQDESLPPDCLSNADLQAEMSSDLQRVSNADSSEYEADFYCFVCLRKFLTADGLKIHETISGFHKKNIQTQRVDMTLLHRL